MSTTAKITKTFTLPKLQPDGSNWIMFQDSVELESASHNLEGHLDGTKVKPVPPVGTGMTPPTTAEKEAYETSLNKWMAGEATIRRGLSEALPPALYLTVRKEATAQDVRKAVIRHHQDKAQLIVVELRTKLQNEKCLEKGDLRAHLAKLRQMREDLALMGENVSDDNFRSIILASLPNSYDNFLISITNQLNPSLITILLH